MQFPVHAKSPGILPLRLALLPMCTATQSVPIKALTTNTCIARHLWQRHQTTYGSPIRAQHVSRPLQLLDTLPTGLRWPPSGINTIHCIPAWGFQLWFYLNSLKTWSSPCLLKHQSVSGRPMPSWGSLTASLLLADLHRPAQQLPWLTSNSQPASTKDQRVAPSGSRERGGFKVIPIDGLPVLHTWRWIVHQDAIIVIIR